MAKIDPNFPHDIFQFIHKPIRDADLKDGNSFLERFLIGAQSIFEDTQAKIETVKELLDPELTPQPKLLKDHVGFTKELNNITNDLTDNDLRKLISLAVALFKQKGIEPGYINIVRLFTGKSARVFDWFDFRMIVGEAAFGEEQLGEDSWLISVPGVEASSDTSNNVVGLWTFEGNAKDRSLTRNDGTEHDPSMVSYFDTPITGFPQGSDKYVRLSGGLITVPDSSTYDLSSNFTIEGFIRATAVNISKTLFHKRDGAGIGLQVNYDSGTNTISFVLDDGTVTVAAGLTPTFTINDGILRHFALVMDRVNGVRLYMNGTEATPIIPLGLLGDLTNNAQIILGGASVIGGNFIGDMDNFRLALNNVYNVTLGTHLVPITGFIEFQEELLDEFQTDIRIADEGNLNKVLIQRILNLMRPVSERINVIFVRFFDDFLDGVGQFELLSGNVRVNTEQQMELNENANAISFVRTDVLNDSEFRDIVLQSKIKETDIVNGGIFSILFFVQDALNYYEYRIDTVVRKVALFKVIAGISTQIGLDITEDIVPGGTYIYTVATSFNTVTSTTQIQTFVDSNKQHEIIDGAFNKGKFGYLTDLTTTIQIDEIEMLQLPVDVQKISPGFNL